MASAANRLGAQLIRQSFRTRPAHAGRQLSRPAAFFHRSACVRDDEKPEASGKAASRLSSSTKSASPASDGASAKKSKFDSEEPAEYIDYGEVSESEAAGEGFLEFQPGMTRDEQAKEMEKWREIMDNPPEEIREAVEQYKSGWSRMEADMMRQKDDGETFSVPDNFMQSRPKLGFFAAGEEDPHEAGEDEEFAGDDITSLAHGQLDQHREIRHYTRLAAWELPLLSKFAKKYEPPTSDRPLRFRYTTYMGEEHPAEKKIVVEFCTADLPLTPEQRLKLVKLVSSRYDPQKDLVRMSCEMFDTAAQNKRYLADLVDSLVKEAKNESTAEGGKDSFADVAPDFRHVKWKKRLTFPDSWKVDDQRKFALRKERSRRILAEKARISQGELVDGNLVIEKALNAIGESSYVPIDMSRNKPAARIR